MSLLPPETGPTAQSDRLDGLAATDIDFQVEQVTMELDRSLKASSFIDWYERRDASLLDSHTVLAFAPLNRPRIDIVVERNATAVSQTLHHTRDPHDVRDLGEMSVHTY